MSTATAPARREVSTPAQFRQQASTIAYTLLKDWVGEERAKEATGRIASAVSASAAASKDPSEFYRCTPQSVATCVAISALTGIMPSTGSSALAYLVPQPPRKGEPPILQYMLSHRGLNALARRCGQVMVAIPIGHKDQVETDDYGMFRVVSRDIDNPPIDEDELRGVVVVIKEISSGIVTATGWVPKKLIDQRKAMSRSAHSSYSPWAKWYVEMAQKTAMHYAISRGWCVIDDTEAVRALKHDSEADLLTGPRGEAIEGRVAKGTEGLRAKLGVSQEAETFAPAEEPEGEPAYALHGDDTQQVDDYQLSEACRQFTARMNKTTKAESLIALAAEVDDCRDLAEGEQESLMAELSDRIAAAKAEAPA